MRIFLEHLCNLTKGKLKGNTQFLFLCNTAKIKHLTSLHHFSSNNPKSTNRIHTSLAGADHLNSKLFTNIQCEKNNHSAFLLFQKICKKIIKKNYISNIFWTFKGKLQIVHAATYIALLLPDSNNYFFICLVPYIHICLYYFLILCFYFHLLFLTLLATRHILQFTMFCLISCNIRELKNIPRSPRQKKNWHLNYNPAKCFNIIIFGWCNVYEFFVPPYQLTFFVAFG